MAPSAPARETIRDRVITILQAIVTGDNYFYTPYEVTQRFIHWKEANGFPIYMVTPDSGGFYKTLSNHMIDAKFYLSIKGIVEENVDDPGTALFRAHTDIQKAINYDSHSGGSGSFLELGVIVSFEEPPITDNGYLATEGGFGFFDQRVGFQLITSFGAL